MSILALDLYLFFTMSCILLSLRDSCLKPSETTLKPCGVGSYLVVLLLLAVAVVEGYRKQKLRTSGSNVELENEVPCSLQEKSKGSNFLDDSALESK